MSIESIVSISLCRSDCEVSERQREWVQNRLQLYDYILRRHKWKDESDSDRLDDWCSGQVQT